MESDKVLVRANGPMGPYTKANGFWTNPVERGNLSMQTAPVIAATSKWESLKV
jgi:hypothetical protein